MREMGLAVKIEDDWLPTIGGLMLFGLNERIAGLLPRVDVLLTRFSGAFPKASSSPVIESHRLQGNLLRLADGSLNFIKRFVDLRETRPSRKTRESGSTQTIEEIIADSHGQFVPGRANYHHGAIVEALANFLAHRDLSARDRQARINIYDDCIEFINPAQPPELPMASLRYGLTCAPNPRLKSIFTNRNYGAATAASSISGGLAMICAETINFARRAPEGPNLTNNEFRLKVHGLL